MGDVLPTACGSNAEFTAAVIGGSRPDQQRCTDGCRDSKRLSPSQTLAVAPDQACEAIQLRFLRL
jgi:hypothetical protein